MNSIVETITPAKALEYLRTNKGNRPISKVTVRCYADSMRQGKWVLNGAPIVFDNEGHLMDGHHRLHAIVEANVPALTLVVRGVESNAFTTYDCGLRRNLGQLLALQGVKNYVVCAATVLAAENLRKTGKLYANNGNSTGTFKTSNDSNYDVYDKDRERFNYVTERACFFFQQAPILKKSWIGGLYYHLTKIGKWQDSVVEEYFSELCSMTESKIRAIELLRSRIIKERIRGIKSDNSSLYALFCKSWKYYIEGTSPQLLKYDSEREEYPKLLLNDKII